MSDNTKWVVVTIVFCLLIESCVLRWQRDQEAKRQQEVTIEALKQGYHQTPNGFAEPLWVKRKDKDVPHLGTVPSN